MVEYNIHRVMSYKGDALAGFAVCRCIDNHSAQYRGKRPLWTGMIEDIIQAGDLFMTEDGANEVIKCEVEHGEYGKAKVKDDPGEDRAAREHERMRRDLWCAAYVAAVGARANNRDLIAKNAVRLFDLQFPTPIPIHQTTGKEGE